MVPVVICELRSIMLSLFLAKVTAKCSSVTTVKVGKILRMETVMNIFHNFQWEKDSILTRKYILSNFIRHLDFLIRTLYPWLFLIQNS